MILNDMRGISHKFTKMKQAIFVIIEVPVFKYFAQFN